MARPARAASGSGGRSTSSPRSTASRWVRHRSIPRPATPITRSSPGSRSMTASSSRSGRSATRMPRSSHTWSSCVCVPPVSSRPTSVSRSACRRHTRSSSPGQQERRSDRLWQPFKDAPVRRGHGHPARDPGRRPGHPVGRRGRGRRARRRLQSDRRARLRAAHRRRARRLPRTGRTHPPNVGLHLCYGDYKHRHFKAPTDLGAAGPPGQRGRCSRPVRLRPHARGSREWSRPRPISRRCSGLHANGTELALGVIDYENDSARIDELVAAADTAGRPYAVATECGMARLGERGEAVTLEDLLGQHARVAAPVR